jgi:hypothetical protein
VFAVCTFNSVETPFEKLWRVVVVGVRPGEIPLESKIEPRAVTRRGSIQGHLYIICQNDYPYVSYAVPLNRTTFGVAKYVSTLEIAVYPLADTNIVVL